MVMPFAASEAAPADKSRQQGYPIFPLGSVECCNIAIPLADAEKFWDAHATNPARLRLSSRLAARQIFAPPLQDKLREELQLRTSRPGLAPVSASFSRVITPLQKVAR